MFPSPGSSSTALEGAIPDINVPKGTPNAAQLLPKAKEFEAILLGQWLQGAESSFGSVPGAEDDQDAGSDQFKGFAVQQLAKNITESGGIGIAAIVARALAKSSSGLPGHMDTTK